MVDSEEVQNQKRENPVELAIAVSQRVEIQNVLLTQCGANRSPEMDLQREGSVLQYGISEIRYAREAEGNTLFVLPSFNLDILQKGESDPESVLSVSATFALIYHVESFEGITPRQLEAFSVTNGIFNAWPYWREFVQNTTSRMGVKGSITVPVFRIGDNPLEKHSSPLKPIDSDQDKRD